MQQSTQNSTIETVREASHTNQELSALEASVYSELARGQLLLEAAKSHDLSEITVMLLAKRIVQKLGARSLREAVSMKAGS